MPIVKVCIPHTFRNSFDYHGLAIPLVGTRVRVPFRHQQRIGIVVAIEDEPEHPNIKIKTLISIIDDLPLLPLELLHLCQWVSEYYHSPLSEVLPLALPKRYQRGEPCQLPLQISYSLVMPACDAHSLIKPAAKRQHELIDFLSQALKPLTKREVIKAGFSPSQLKALLECDLLQGEEKILPPFFNLKPSPPLALNLEQHEAVKTITACLHQYRCFLLQGITGSGKTEVYLHVVAQVLAQGKQVLILVPEIGLTPQLLNRFTARFAVPMATLHSQLNDTERQQAWQLAAKGAVQLIIGTRSAVFTPFPKLGLIILDEEHDGSFKQMEGVRYSARDTALMRAHLANIPIVLGSATPSLESLYNIHRQKFTPVYLTQRAAATCPLHYQVLDLRNQTLTHGLAAPTLALIKTHLDQQNQVLVFINRRGFAPVLLCHQCGWMADCRACDSHLTLHRAMHKLICHHCGLMHNVISNCQRCQSRELIPIGSGTQRVYEHLATQFPTTALLRIDRDETSQKNALAERLAAIHEGHAQLIVGTQMLAKGHDFPRLTLVVVMDTDNGFFNQDFRALERLGQLLTQVAGRAGRAQFPGQVLIQTYVPNHPLLNLLIREGYTAFAKALLTMRANAMLPPYAFLALFRAQGKHLPKLLEFMHTIKAQLTSNAVEVLGPAPAPLARKADHHRMQLLIKAQSRTKLKLALTPLRDWLTMNKLSGSIRWNLDIDPMDLA